MVIVVIKLHQVCQLFLSMIVVCVQSALCKVLISKKWGSSVCIHTQKIVISTVLVILKEMYCIEIHMGRQR